MFKIQDIVLNVKILDMWVVIIQNWNVNVVWKGTTMKSARMTPNVQIVATIILHIRAISKYKEGLNFVWMGNRLVYHACLYG